MLWADIYDQKNIKENSQVLIKLESSEMGRRRNALLCSNFLNMMSANIYETSHTTAQASLVWQKAVVEWRGGTIK